MTHSVLSLTGAINYCAINYWQAKHEELTRFVLSVSDGSCKRQLLSLEALRLCHLSRVRIRVRGRSRVRGRARVLSLGTLRPCHATHDMRNE